MLHLPGETAGLVGRELGVRLQPVGGLGQVDEVVDACAEQSAKLGCGLPRILVTRILAGREAAGDHPVAVGSAGAQGCRRGSMLATSGLVQSLTDMRPGDVCSCSSFSLSSVLFATLEGWTNGRP